MQKKYQGHRAMLRGSNADEGLKIEVMQVQRVLPKAQTDSSPLFHWSISTSRLLVS
jgi:hypothetical protein